MAGSVEGGLKARETIKKRHGADFYNRLGRVGGKISKTGGFASHKIGADGLDGPQRAVLAGAKSKRVIPQKIKDRKDKGIGDYDSK